MRIAIPKEIKVAERRVALTPSACRELVAAGHDVTVQASAGTSAGFSDDAYIAVGCSIAADAAATYAAGDMIVKVKEPQADDLKHLRSNHLLFCYLHLAAEPALTQALKQIGLTAVAFETVTENGRTPLLAPMSAVAGRLAVQIGTWYLHAPRGGRGVLMGGIEGLSHGRVTVIGAGVAGTEAAHLAYQMGAHVRMFDINPQRLDALKAQYPNMETVLSTPEAISAALPETDLLVGAVYVVGKRAPHVVSAAQVATMPQGSVVIDISIDQGGCIETSRPCTHDNPIYTVDGVIHSAITNLPGAVPLTSSQALSAAILPYVEKLAAGEWNDGLRAGINVQGGELKIAV